MIKTSMSVSVNANGKSISVSQMTIEGKVIQTDPSGRGNAWRAADEDSCPANIQDEIAAEIIDGKMSETSDYVASNGVHYRWS